MALISEDMTSAASHRSEWVCVDHHLQVLSSHEHGYDVYRATEARRQGTLIGWLSEVAMWNKIYPGTRTGSRKEVDERDLLHRIRPCEDGFR